MAELTLQDVFGAGATQTATSITFLKSDLSSMTASAANRGEQTFAAICAKAGRALTETGFSTNRDQSIVMKAGFDSLAYRPFGTVQETLLQTQLVINFARVQAQGGIDPDAY